MGALVMHMVGGSVCKVGMICGVVDLRGFCIAVAEVKSKSIIPPSSSVVLSSTT